GPALGREDGDSQDAELVALEREEVRVVDVEAAGDREGGEDGGVVEDEQRRAEADRLRAAAVDEEDEGGADEAESARQQRGPPRHGDDAAAQEGVERGEAGVEQGGDQGAAPDVAGLDVGEVEAAHAGAPWESRAAIT